MSTKILVPVSGSANSLKAVDEAIRVARNQPDATIQLLNVQPRVNRHIGAHSSSAARNAFFGERAERALGAAHHRVQAAGIPVSKHMVYGRFADAVARFAREQQAGLIVMTTVKLSGLAAIFGRTLAQQLAAKTDLPIEVIPVEPTSALEQYGVPAGLGLGLTAVWLAAE